jgi:hypothetical protein
MVLGIAAVAILGLPGRAEATPIFTVNLSPSSAGLSFVTSVFDFTPHVVSTGNETAVLGAPDALQGFDPNVPQIVDFGGVLPWSVSMGFGTTFADGPGVDVRVFLAQLDPAEGFDMYASANGVSFVLLGTYPGPALTASQLAPMALDIDFNGAAVPAGAQYLRFVGPGDTNVRGLDFDAVGVVPVGPSAAAVPEPASLTLVAGGAFLSLLRRRRRA